MTCVTAFFSGSGRRLRGSVPDVAAVWRGRGLASRVRLAGLLAALAVAGFSNAESTTGLQAQAGFPRWGGTPRVIEHYWAEMPFVLINPQAVPERFRYTVQAEGQEGMVFVKITPTGPEAVSDRELLLTAAGARQYNSTLTDANGNLLHRQDVFSDFQNAYGKATVFVISDYTELSGVSDLAKRDDLIQGIVITRSPGSRMPEHWAAYGNTAIIVLHDVDFSGLTALQYQAVVDFVGSGGSLLIVSPATLLNAAQTPLRKLLPVTPLHLREIEELALPPTWAGGASALRWNDAALFVEAVAGAESRVTLRANDFPVLAWKKYGLGRVGAVAIDPFDQVFRQHQASPIFWNHVLSWSTRNPLTHHALYTEPVLAAEQRLIGFRIPGVNVVRAILLGYGLLLILIFMLGFLLRRQVGAWGVSVLLALVLTGTLFFAAFRQASDRPTRSMTTLSLSCFGDTAVAGAKSVNLFSKVDEQTDLVANDGFGYFHAAPPPPSPLPASEGMARPPLLVIEREEGISAVRRLAVHALKSTKCGLVFRRARETAATAAGVVVYTDDRPRLDNCAVPDGVPAEARGYLKLPNGALPLDMRDGRCRINYSGSAPLQLETVAGDFAEFIARSDFTSPSLVFIYRSDTPSREFSLTSTGYREMQYCIDLYPVREAVLAGNVAVLSEQIRITPASKATRTLFWSNKWQEMSLYGTSEYILAAELPPTLRGMELRDLTVDLAFHAPAGGVDMRVDLLPYSEYRRIEEGGGRDMVSLPPAEQRGPLSIFRLKQGDPPVCDPVTGRVYIRLTVFPKNSAGSRGQTVQPTTRWRMIDFRVSATGKTEEEQYPARF